MSQAPPAAAGRGILLIAAAVVLGLILLSQGFDDGAASSRASNDGGDATVAPDSTETVPASTIPDALPPEQVPVVVSNAAGISGLAGQVTEQLAALGYIMSEPETAPALSDFTAVYFVPNFQAEARAVATALGYPPDQVVQPSPEPAPAGSGTEVVIVVLGADAETLAAGGGDPTATTAPTDTLLAPG